jgi:two-component system sensor histidine kinase RegB
MPGPHNPPNSGSLLMAKSATRSESQATIDAKLLALADPTGRRNLEQLIQLRWIAVAGQVVTIASVSILFHVGLPLLPMSLVLGFLVTLNVVSLIRLKAKASVSNRELFLTLVLDIAALTAQLYLSGGATNPFTSLYLLQVILGAVLLDSWSIWILVLLTAACFAGLTIFYQPLQLPIDSRDSLSALHIQGLLISFLLDSCLLVVFVARISKNLRLRDARLADFRQQAAEEDHIVRMGLLASGAAHELGTPLSTLSVILNDWRRMPTLQADPQLAEEIGEMEGEVARCKAIVTGILLSAGEARGEAPIVTTVGAFLDDILDDWRDIHPEVEVVYHNVFQDELTIISDVALRQVVFNVLDNAAEASPQWVGFAAEQVDDMLVITVTDAGPGFAPAILANFGKPYNSSKGRLGGGLGLFLVVNVVRKLGGAVTARNRATGGASVTLSMPLSALMIEGASPDGQ